MEELDFGGIAASSESSSTVPTASHHVSVLAFLKSELQGLEETDSRFGKPHFFVSRILSSRFVGSRGNNLKFPGRTNRGRDSETPKQTAIRAFWEEFGMKVTEKDLKLMHIEVVETEKRIAGTNQTEPQKHVRYYYVVQNWGKKQKPRVGQKMGQHPGTWFQSHPDGDIGAHPKYKDELLSAEWELLGEFWKGCFQNYREAFQKIARHYALRYDRDLLEHLVACGMYPKNIRIEELEEDETEDERQLEIDLNQLPNDAYNAVMFEIESISEEEELVKDVA